MSVKSFLCFNTWPLTVYFHPSSLSNSFLLLLFNSFLFQSESTNITGAYKALCNLAALTWSLIALFLCHSTSATLASLLFLQQCSQVSDSELLHLLFLLIRYPYGFLLISSRSLLIHDFSVTSTLQAQFIFSTTSSSTFSIPFFPPKYKLIEVGTLVCLVCLLWLPCAQRVPRT